jgi:hypothetical protein
MTGCIVCIIVNYYYMYTQYRLHKGRGNKSSVKELKGRRRTNAITMIMSRKNDGRRIKLKIKGCAKSKRVSLILARKKGGCEELKFTIITWRERQLNLIPRITIRARRIRKRNLKLSVRAAH